MKGKAGDEVESKSELQKSGSSSTPCLYMFAHLHPRQFGYVLYKIDYKHLLDSNSNSNINDDDEGISTPLPLMPFLVFYPGDLPDRFCSLLHLGDYLYFLGQKQSDFFKIAKSDIQHLVPSEHNVGSHYLKRLEPPMNSHKHEPIVFVAKGNLYTISRINHRDSPFEMFSPSKNSWTILNPRPRGPYGPFKSHVLLGDNLYFATSPLDPGFYDHDESVFSYNLTHNLWKLLTTSSCRPAFEHPILPIANMLFGGFSLPYRGIQSTVAASPYTVLNDSDTDAKAMFMRPTLAPEPNFWPEFFLRDKYASPLCSPSYYMTDLGHENVLCFISYGQHPRSADIMAFFTFFKIPGDFWSADPVLLGKEPNDCWNFCHYARQVDSDSKHAVKSYFKSEFMHRKLFKISTDELLVDYGRLITCFSY